MYNLATAVTAGTQYFEPHRNLLAVEHFAEKI